MLRNKLMCRFGILFYLIIFFFKFTFHCVIFMCVTVQWRILLLLVEYSCVSQYSGVFYF